MGVKIYMPAKNAMQSGRGSQKKWVLEYEPNHRQDADPLMGWVGGGGTRQQVRLKFESKDDAIAFAQRQGLAYQVIDPKKRKIRPKSYAANFAHDRVV